MRKKLLGIIMVHEEDMERPWNTRELQFMLEVGTGNFRTYKLLRKPNMWTKWSQKSAWRKKVG